MKLPTFLSVFFYLALLLSIAEAAPIFGLWGSEPVLDVYDNGVEHATFTLADAPKSEQNTGSLLSRFPIFDTLLPWGITKTETDDMMSIYTALSEPEKEIFVNTVHEQVEKSGGKAKFSWKSFFKRFWSWASGLFSSWGKKKDKVV
ncbi:uncharacterized protein H6S33_000077 [Morchella sextelata]|uniref:uncharacterized protein n=1 Tax=Morchella sextelata TaxID=1174677 RepID=UPI001D041EAA|nr:uncharacterized protein H6S33_000077 [Morchella sextelata]KAH0614441.1 hypothetical protein H6S33_000077 [Morchella sextelata]